MPALLGLQGVAGNAAVAGLVAQRLACPPGPVAPEKTTAAADPAFAGAKRGLAANASLAKQHPPAGKEVKEAQDAAVAPADDKEAQAKAAQTDKMAAAKAGGFDKAAFIAAVSAAVAAKAPKNLDDAAKFATSGKADEVKNEVMGKVTAGKDASVKDVATTTAATPDTSTAKDKPVTAMPPAAPPPRLAAPDPKAVAPKPAPAEQTRLGGGSCETNCAMTDAGVTEEQLAKSNEPELTGALAAKKTAEEHDKTAPAQVKKMEAQTIAGAQAQADSVGKAGVASMTSAKQGALAQAGAGKTATKAKDETERVRITGEIKKIFDGTKTEVEKILGGIDKLVEDKFTTGEASAKSAFTADHEKRMRDYKLRRYGGPFGPQLWLKDLILDLPAEANALFQESKKLYEAKMTAVISDIADAVGAELTRAKTTVADGRAKVQQFVSQQGPNLQKIAGEAASDIGSQFDDLEKSVDEKQDSVVEDLADRYAEARDAVDDEIKKLQEANKGLVSQAKDAVGGAIETIKKLKDMLLGVLARAANAVEKIIKDPMGFLEKFINAVKAGVTNFLGNILTHLKKGLQSWLFGALADAGIEIPEKFDLKGIIGLVMSLLGLTWTAVRARIVKQVGEPVMGKIEGAVDFVKVAATEGLPGVWKWISGKLSDLKDQVMGQIRDFVITKVITAGITWLISLLNPAAAFIKACKMIYDAVMWFVDNAARLKEFVDSVLDSVESIAAGGVGAVATLIENTLAKTIPMLISGLASLLGLGGIASKIKDVLEKVQKPVGMAVDWLVGKAVKYGKKFLGKLKNSKLGKAAATVKAKAKAAYTKGKAWVKGKYEAGKTWVKGKVESGKKWVKDKVAAARGFLSATCAQLMAFAFNTSFTAEGKPHRLYTNPGTPDQLYVASTPRTLVQAFAHLKKPERDEISALDGSFRYQMRQYRERIKALRDRGADWAAANPAAVEAEKSAIQAIPRAAKEAQLAILEFVKKHMRPADGPGAHAPGIASVAPYRAKLASLHNDVPEWKMTAEHIIPDGLLRATMMGLNREGWVHKGDTGYKDQTTIMIYNDAASEKTGGWVYNPTRGGDQDLIIRMKNVVGMARSRAGGDGSNLRKTDGSGVTPKRYWRVYLKEQFEGRIQPLFASLSAQALSRTKAAVKAEQRQVESNKPGARGSNAPTRPNDAELDTAYQAQKAHMETILNQSRDEADFD